MPNLTVTRQTATMIKLRRLSPSFNDTSRDNGDGTVTFPVDAEVFTKLQRLRQPAETLEDTLRRALWAYKGG